MKFTCFDSLYDNRPRTHDGWSELVKTLSSPIISSDKKAAPLYSAAVYTDGTATRSNANVAYLSLAIFDLDAASEDQVLNFVADVSILGLAAFFHTTHSWASGLAESKYKSRLIVPFHRPVFPDEWDRTWSGIEEFARIRGVTIDPACKDPSRAYYFPSAARAEDCQILEYQGVPINVEHLIAISPPQAARTTFKAPSADVLARIESSTRFQLARLFVTSFPAAVANQGGDLMTYRAACIGNDFGLSKEEFWPLLLEFNTRCEPPWEEADLNKKLDNAIAYSTLPFGWRLVHEGKADVVAKTDIERVINSLIKKEYSAPTGRVMRSMLAGEALIGNEPDKVLQKIAKALGNAFTSASGKQIATLFKDSIEKTQHRDVNLDAFATLIHTAQEDLRAEAVSRSLKVHEETANRYAQAFRKVGIARRTAYTDVELASFRKTTPTEMDFDQSWVIAHGGTYYFRVFDRYLGPYNKDSWNAGEALLSPTNISFHEYSEHNKKPRSIQSVVLEHGVVADHVVLDMTAQKSYFDYTTSTMVEAPCPRRDIKAKYHPNVDTWINLLCGKQEKLYERVLDWLASVPELSEPTCALILYGAPQTGKSLMSAALARLYTTGGPTEIEDVTGNFNSMLIECAITAADETVPREGGRPNTQLLRKLIAQRERTLKRKGIPDAKLIGAMRLIMSANNLSGLIDQHDELTEHDIEALCERFLLVYIEDTTPKAFLDSLPDEERMEITHYTAIAEHCLWLWNNRTLRRGHRLIVEGFPDSEMADGLRAGTGLRPEVIEFTAEYVAHPDKLLNVNYRPIIHQLPDGRKILLLSPKVLSEHWTTVLTQRQKVPRLQGLQRALEALSIRLRRVAQRTYYEMDLVEIRKYAGSLGVDIAEFDAGMVKAGLRQPQDNDILDIDGNEDPAANQ